MERVDTWPDLAAWHSISKQKRTICSQAGQLPAAFRAAQQQVLARAASPIAHLQARTPVSAVLRLQTSQQNLLWAYLVARQAAVSAPRIPAPTLTALGLCGVYAERSCTARRAMPESCRSCEERGRTRGSTPVCAAAGAGCV